MVSGDVERAENGKRDEEYKFVDMWGLSA